jgi:hypothetical protein
MTILYFLLGFIVTALVIAAVVGTGWTIERSVIINAPADRIWKEMGTLRLLNSWNPWSTQDPDIKLDFKGEDGQPGSSYTWDSQVKSVGAGQQTILSTIPNKELHTRVDFYKPFKGTGNSYLKLDGQNGATKVSWGMVSSTPYPMNILKVFGFIEKSMDKPFKQGLNELKRRSEG